jgi:hypothetical protein
MPKKRPAINSEAPLQDVKSGRENNNGSNSIAVSASANFDQMSNEEIRSELQRWGIQTCESTPKEFLHPLLKLAMELKTNTPNAIFSTTQEDGDREAFFCSICTDEYSPTDELAKVPRKLPHPISQSALP